MSTKNSEKGIEEYAPGPGHPHTLDGYAAWSRWRDEQETREAGDARRWREVNAASVHECGCRCHRGTDGFKYCCPQCEPEAYDLCSCGAERYKHNDAEREWSPGGCDVFSYAAPEPEPT